MRSVAPGNIDGTAAAPTSKSVFIRAVAAATLSPGATVLHDVPGCDDSAAALRAAVALGATVTRVAGERNAIRVTGGGAPAQGAEIDCGESALTLRLFAAVAALFPSETTLAAQGSLRGRPMEMLAEPLRALGARCTTSRGAAPVVVRGPLRGGAAVVDGRRTSQGLTGLLVALPRCEESSELRVQALASRPYTQLTLDVLARFGVRVHADERFHKILVPGRQTFAPVELTIDGDWSGAAFLLVAGAIAGRVRVTGLDPASSQADRAILKLLAEAGAEVHTRELAVEARRGTLRPFELDVTHCPDLAPPAAVLAACCPGTSRIRGVVRLRSKESDRAAALESSLRALGGQIRAQDDYLEITGGELRGGTVAAGGDHRIAMAAAVAGLVAHEGVTVTDAECVRKSFPHFFETLAALGAEVT